MNIVNELRRFNYLVVSQNLHVIFLFKLAIDIVWNIAALGRHKKLFSIVSLFLDEVVESSIDAFLRFAEAIQSAAVDYVHTACENGVY